MSGAERDDGWCSACGNIGCTPDCPDYEPDGATPAPSPSIPDPSDERGALVATARRIGCTLANQLADEIERLAAACPTSLPEAPEPDEVAELRELSDQATPGEWAWRNSDALYVVDDTDSPYRFNGRVLGLTTTVDGDQEIDCAEADADFIVAAVNFVRSILAATPPAPPVAVDPEARAGAS